jgi:hypothetical protein
LWPDGIVDRRAGLHIGVDSTTGAVLAGTQVRRLLEPDDHLTIRLPPLFMDVVGQVPSERARGEIGVGAHLLEVVPTEGNDVFVGGQKAISVQPLDAVARFAAQHGLDLLRNDRSPEHSRERVVDGRLELALDPRRQPPLATHAPAFARTCPGTSPPRGKRFAG